MLYAMHYFKCSLINIICKVVTCMQRNRGEVTPYGGMNAHVGILTSKHNLQDSNMCAWNRDEVTPYGGAAK